MILDWSSPVLPLQVRDFLLCHLLVETVCQFHFSSIRLITSAALKLGSISVLDTIDAVLA